MGILQVGEIMSTTPIVVDESDSIYAVADKMKKYRVSSVVVLDTHKQLSGILTVNDISRKGVATRLDLNEPVTKIMSTDVVTISPSRDVTEAMTLFNQYGINQAPVVQDNKLVGYITLKDVLRYEPAMLDIAVQQMHAKEETRQEIIDRLMNATEMDDLDEELLH